jgi:hypothetical protein
LGAERNALYASWRDPSAAVIFDRDWVLSRAQQAGLTAVQIIPPAVRNHQWVVVMTPTRAGIEEADFPPDEAPAASVDSPPMPADAERIGLAD